MEEHRVALHKTEASFLFDRAQIPPHGLVPGANEANVQPLPRMLDTNTRNGEEPYPYFLVQVTLQEMRL